MEYFKDDHREEDSFGQEGGDVHENEPEDLMRSEPADNPERDGGPAQKPNEAKTNGGNGRKRRAGWVRELLGRR